MSELPKKVGPYTIVREIGRGSTAIVYLAEAPDGLGQVALKHIRFDSKVKDEAKHNRRLVKLLRAEKAVSTRLDHPNIIRIHEVCIEAQQAYVVMEYFPGESLERHCSFERLLPVPRTIGIIFKCCMALDHAYRRGIVHRDIKPANILVDEHDNVKITDFGLALNINKQVDADSTFVMGVGSPAYMSPEQIKGYPLNQKTDLYSLGVVMFHLLTGRLPFRATTPGQLIYKIINADPPSASRLNPGVPAQMDTVIQRALEKDLYSRYRNGAEFAKDLAAMRYSLFDDTYVPPDTRRFSVLRRMPFFTEFEDVEVWEVLLLSTWRQVDREVVLMREGDTDQRFAIVLEGRVELSVAGLKAIEVGAGEIFGEQAWLDSIEHRQAMTIVSVEPLTYLEINTAALALASDEVIERFRAAVATRVVRRLADVARALALHFGLPATVGHAAGESDLRLADL